MKLEIQNNHFIKDGKPVFWLADTLWSLFTNMSDDEIDSYLTLRKQQGFNTLQINILPQWDRCWVNAPYMPFALKEDGSFDYEKGMNPEYFDHARKIIEKVTNYGFTPALVVLWANYVPDNWASRMNGSNIMPKEFIEAYCTKVAETFDEFNPVYVISGDTDLDNDSTVEHYQLAMDTMNKLSPDTLKTMHIKGRYSYIPQSLADKMDFFFYQSGHNGIHLDSCFKLAEEMSAKYPDKPLINSEPCYEQMGFSGNKYGRFAPKDIRRAAWLSILSGASAGITYGAHGVWNWQKVNTPANPNTGEGFDAAKPASEAMYFPGAWDYGFIRQQLEGKDITPDGRLRNMVHSLERYTDENGVVQMRRKSEPNPEIRMATTKDGKESFIYAPINTNILVEEDLTNTVVKTIDMETKNIAYPIVSYKDGVSKIEICPFDADILVKIER